MFKNKVYLEKKADSDKVYQFFCHPEADLMEVKNVLAEWHNQVHQILENAKKQQEEKKEEVKDEEAGV